MAYYRFPDGTVADLSHATKDATLITAKEFKAGRQAQAVRRLHEIIGVGDSIRAVNIGGNSYRVFAADRRHQGVVTEITGTVIDACGFSRTRHHAISMGGYGYSKSFEIGYSLGLAMWPNGTPEPHGTRNGEPDSCGGYAIRCEG